MPSDYYVSRFGTAAGDLLNLKAIARSLTGRQARLKRKERQGLDAHSTVGSALSDLPDVRLSKNSTKIIWKQPEGTANAVTGAVKYTLTSIRAFIAANPNDWSVSQP